VVALERRGVIAHLLVSIGLLVGLGVFGYLTIIALPGGKAPAERFLMVAVILGLFSIVSAYMLYRRGHDLDQMLRIAEQRVRQGGFSAGEFFRQRRLGTLGKDLAAIYRGIEEVSEKKSLRIGALNALNSFLLARLEERMVVINVKGEIFQVSDAFVDSLETKRGEVIGQDLTKLLPEFDLDKAISHFYRENTALELGSEADSMRVYPVFDARREIAYCVIVFGEEKEVALPDLPEDASGGSGPRQRRWFGRMRDRLREGRSSDGRA
jgi:PAS domain-containing protein